MIKYTEIAEYPSEKYTPRTYYNAKTADLTLAYAIDFNTAGERCTHKAAGDKYISLDFKHDDLINSRRLYSEMMKRDVRILNIAGNGIYTFSKYSVTQEQLNIKLYNVLNVVCQHYSLSKIISGGQTGVDFAGGVVAELLEIPCLMTFPKGYIQRFEDRKDIKMEKDKIIENLNIQVEKLKVHIRNEV